MLLNGFRMTVRLIDTTNGYTPYRHQLRF